MAPKFCSCVTLHLLDHIWKLHSVLDTSVQERHWQTEVSSEGHEDGWGKLDKSPVRRNWGYWASSASGIKSFRRTWEQPVCWSHTKGHNGKMRQGAWVGTWAEVQIWFKKNLCIVGDGWSSGASFPGSFWSVHPWSFASSKVSLCSWCSFEQEVDLETAQGSFQPGLSYDPISLG